MRSFLLTLTPKIPGQEFGVKRRCEIRDQGVQRSFSFDFFEHVLGDVLHSGVLLKTQTVFCALEVILDVARLT